jgi:protein-S-isoprenylcysteine O-methyltransferase Ste14
MDRRFPITIISMRPPRLALLLTAAALVAHIALNDERSIHVAVPWLGATLGIGGAALMMLAWWLFKRNHVAVCPTARTARLITSGPFRFTRNPMYVGMLAILFGLALIMGSLPFYLSFAAFFGLLNHFFCPYEENKLTDAFGAEYVLYKKNVRRWL